MRRPVERYVEPIDLLDVERRVIRACKTIRALPDKERKYFSTQQGIWNNYVHDMESYNIMEDEKPRFRPKPFDVSDCLNALSWCRTMGKNDFQYIWWRSFDISFGVIAHWIGRSDETARVRYKDSILKAWHAANFEQRKAYGRVELQRA